MSPFFIRAAERTFKSVRKPPKYQLMGSSSFVRPGSRKSENRVTRNTKIDSGAYFRDGAQEKLRRSLRITFIFDAANQLKGGLNRES